MKTPRALLIILTVSLLALCAWVAPTVTPLLAITAAAAVLVMRPMTAELRATLTVAEILADVLEAFKTRVPMLSYFSTDMSADSVKFNQQIIAHLPILPTAYDHNTTNGYKDNAQKARDLLVDVPITINQWKDVPVKLNESDVVADRSQNYLKTIDNAAYVLGKSVVDYALGRVLAINFSRVTTETIANTDKDTLSTVRAAMNSVEAGEPRFGLTSTAFMSSLTNDQRIASGDYFGQRIESSPFAVLRNIEGFQEIVEYPKFPANGQNLSAFFFDPRAIGIATRLPSDSTELARAMGIPETYKMEIVQDASGLAIAAFYFIDQNTHDIFIVFSVMFGAVGGKQNGDAGTLVDYAGHRVITA